MAEGPRDIGPSQRCEVVLPDADSTKPTRLAVTSPCYNPGQHDKAAPSQKRSAQEENHGRDADGKDTHQLGRWHPSGAI